MTKHLADQPDHCLQCLRQMPPDKLTGGRCQPCRNRTPAPIWNHHQAMQAVQLDAFRDGNAMRPPLVSRLLPAQEAERMLAEAQAAIDAAQIKRVEQIGPRVLLERYQDMTTGEQIQRVTVRVAEEDTTA